MEGLPLDVGPCSETQGARVLSSHAPRVEPPQTPPKSCPPWLDLLVTLCFVGLDQPLPTWFVFLYTPPYPIPRPPFKCVLPASFGLWVFLLNPCFGIWSVYFQVYRAGSQNSDGAIHFSRLRELVSQVLSACRMLG